MSGRYPYAKRYKYQHMIGDDKIIWERFMDRFPGRFESVDYDWRVGEGMMLVDTWENSIKIMATAVSQKRIDVVGWKDNVPTIIEVKVNVSITTAGQILAYDILFKNEFPNIDKPKLLVVCQSLGHDDKIVLEHFKIKYEII